MRPSDLVRSVFIDAGADTADSFYEHVSTLSRIGLKEFLRKNSDPYPGQFEEAGIRFPPRMLDIRQGRGTPVVIVPVGEIPAVVVGFVCRIVWEVFGIGVRVRRRRTMWADAYDSSSRSADASMILQELPKETDIGHVLALTDVSLHRIVDREDLPGREYIYGYGNMQVPVCVVSTYGFGQFAGNPIPWGRLLRVVVHEIGHTFGLKHHEGNQKDIHCVMNMVHNSDDRPGLDFLTHEFCNRCLSDIKSGRSQFSGSSKENEECWARS